MLLQGDTVEVFIICLNIYLPIVDGALIFDNSEGHHELIADKQIDGLLNIVNHEKFKLLKDDYDNN